VGFEEHSVFATVNTKRLSCYSVEYYYYCCCYAAFDAPCVRHKDDELQAQVLNALYVFLTKRTLKYHSIFQSRVNLELCAGALYTGFH